MYCIKVIVPGWEKFQVFCGTSYPEALEKAEESIPLTTWKNARIFPIDEKEAHKIIDINEKK